MRKRIIAVVAGIAFSMLLMPGVAWANDYFSYLRPQEDGHTLAWGHGQFYYSDYGNPTQETIFIDQRADGDGVYAQADFQAWRRVCPPSLPYCYWAWWDIVEKQTDRYGTADGWVTRGLVTGRDGTSWRDWAKVCVDQSWEPDACDESGVLYP